VFDFREPFSLDMEKIDATDQSLWRYQHSFGLPDSAEPASLGEGGTPLVWVEVRGRQVAFKCEYLNPTGSFKDRGSSLIATWLRSQGVKEAVEDSSGNAGASFAAYAARAGMKACIYVPEAASGPKRGQIEAYGAELVPIAGSRQDVTEAALKAVKKGAAYASHAYLPFNLPGYASAAYEIYEQIGGMPAAVIVPAGQGGFLLGLARGFDALRIAINSVSTPKIIGVQARACAPLWAAFTNGRQGMALASDHATVAEGVRVRYPLRGDAVIHAVRQSGGSILAVDEPAILPARDALARHGLYVEPTSALAWAGLEEVMDDLPDPIVVVLTGFGLKYGVK
jgi:threonine synthase